MQPDASRKRTCPSNRDAPMLEVRNLHRFFGKLRAVNNVSFKAYRGQVMGFIGPNGAGKTTAMRILATLDAPTAGDAFIGGYSVIGRSRPSSQAVGIQCRTVSAVITTWTSSSISISSRGRTGTKGRNRRDAVERVLVFTELRKARKQADHRAVERDVSTALLGSHARP